ncbi:hypothetical protein U1Q18_028829 [Sarracenia purpurea var. burkii]
MNALDSPIEALAFNYLSFGFLASINNIWTWVAVVTAAISFWKIRAAGTDDATNSDARCRKPDGFSSPTVSSVPHTEEAATEPPVSASASWTTTGAPSVSSIETTVGGTKGKFTIYYEDEREEESALGGEVGDGGVGVYGAMGSGCGGGDCWCEDWKRVLRMRMGDEMGWYRYQDLTVLDGSVVRLWDGTW